MNEWVAVITALISGVGAFLLGRNTNKTTLEKAQRDNESKLDELYIGNMTAIVAEYKGQVDRLREEIEALKKEFDEFRKEHEKEVSEYKKYIEMLEEENEGLKVENEHLKEELSTLKGVMK